MAERIRKIEYTGNGTSENPYSTSGWLQLAHEISQEENTKLTLLQGDEINFYINREVYKIYLQGKSRNKGVEFGASLVLSSQKHRKAEDDEGYATMSDRNLEEILGNINTLKKVFSRNVLGMKTPFDTYEANELRLAGYEIPAASVENE